MKIIMEIFLNIWFWIGCIVSGIIAEAIGRAKGKNNCFWWGFLLGIIGIIIVACSKNNKADEYDKLQKLQALKDAGTIDEVEFESYKYKIMREGNNHTVIYSKPGNGSGGGLVIVILIIIIVVLGIILIPNIIDASKSSNGSNSGGSIFTSTTERLAKETQKMITDQWRKDGLYVTVVKDMVLTKKYGNEYSGMMTIRYQGKTIQLTGTVVYDGYYIQWQPDRENLLYQMLY